MRKIVVPLALIGVFCFLATCVTAWSIVSAKSEWSPAWSSDQQHIAFECMFFQRSDLLDDEYSYSGKSDICIFNTGNDKLTRLTTKRGMSAPAWSPNGSLLAWLDRNDSITIWDMATNQSFQSDQLSHGVGGPLEWSQDGQKIFVQGDGIIFDVEQKVVHYPLSRYRSLDNCCFTWSPDGKYVAYQRVVLKDTSRYHWQVVIMQNDETVFMSDLESGLDYPLRWSPDSSTLAWVAANYSDIESSRFQLALTDAAGLNTRYVTFGRGIYGISEIAWSPSGNQIAVRFWNELQIVSLKSLGASGPEVTIQEDNLSLKGSSSTGLSWSPDEKYIAYESNWEPNSRIWILELSSKNQIPLVSPLGD